VEARLVGAGTMLAAHIADKTVTAARALERLMLQWGEIEGETWKAEMIVIFGPNGLLETTSVVDEKTASMLSVRPIPTNRQMDTLCSCRLCSV